MITEHDKKVIEKSRYKYWGDINLSDAETEEGKEELRKIVLRKYHAEECEAGME